MCCGTIKGEMDFAGDFIVLLCVCICSRVCVCMCQHPFLVAASACVSSFSSQESLISPYLSHDRHCFPFPGDTGAFVIQVAGIVTSGATAWEDGGQEYHVLWPPPSLMKSIRCALLLEQRRGVKRPRSILGVVKQTQKRGTFSEKMAFSAPWWPPLSL